MVCESLLQSKRFLKVVGSSSILPVNICEPNLRTLISFLAKNAGCWMCCRRAAKALLREGNNIVSEMETLWTDASAVCPIAFIRIKSVEVSFWFLAAAVVTTLKTLISYIYLFTFLQNSRKEWGTINTTTIPEVGQLPLPKPPKNWCNVYSRRLLLQSRKHLYPQSLSLSCNLQKLK